MGLFDDIKKALFGGNEVNVPSSTNRPKNINIGSSLSDLLLKGQPGVTNKLAFNQFQNQPANRRQTAAPQNISDLMDPYPFTPSQVLKPTNVPNVQPRVDPIQQAMQELQRLQSQQSRSNIEFDPIPLPEYNPTKYKGLAEKTVNEQFNPIIQDLLSRQRTTQTRAKTNQGALKDMYEQLASYVGQDTAQQSKGYDTAQAQSKGLYTDERNRIAAQYAADAASQKEQAQQLGIQALGMPEILAKQSADKNFADQLGSQQMLSSDAALEQQQQASNVYGNQMQGAARSEGAEAQQDIIRQLEDYMTQSNTDLAGTRSQQAGSITDLMTKLADASFQRDTANTQFGYQQQRDYIGDQNALYDRELEMKMKQLEMLQAAAQSGSGKEEKLNPWQATATFAEQVRPGQGSNIVAAIQQAMDARPEIFARSVEDPVKMNPALFAKLIADSDAGRGIDRNSLMMVSQELYRLLYGI